VPTAVLIGSLQVNSGPLVTVPKKDTEPGVRAGDFLSIAIVYAHHCFLILSFITTMITTGFIEQLVKEEYGLVVSATELNGYDERNFLLEGKEKYILKVAGDQHGLYFLDAQIKILDHLAASPVAAKFQRCVKSKAGQSLVTRHTAEGNHYFRLLTYIEGTFWVDLINRPDHLHEALGSFLGAMDWSLQEFSHPAMHRHYTWDISTAMDANRKLVHITSHEKRRIAGYFLLQFETEVLPQLSALRHAYVHNDANDYNLLVKDEAIGGLIDFGDMVYTAVINNVAVACTYAMLGHQDPLHAAGLVVKGYHQVNPLSAEELDLLYYLVAARLCISVTQSAYNASMDSSNEHHFITEAPAWKLLFRLIRMNPLKARDHFYVQCGYGSVITAADHRHMLEDRHQFIGRNLSISYRKKIKIDKGALQYLYDDQGRTYIDCVNNPSHAGHCHPVVVHRMQKQLATLNTNTRYLNDNIIEYAKRLTATLDPSLCVCYFTNSGSEANDLAIRMSRHFTGQKDVIVLDHAYHGTSTVAMEMSPYKFDGKGGFGQMPWIHKAMNPDTYRGPYRKNDPDAGKKYAADVARIIEELRSANKAPGAFICETLLGVGGQIPLPDAYLQEVYRTVRNAGGICIADEVQVGFGRVGEAFWGFELQHVIPDIVVMGKPIGNGHPLAAVVVTEAIASAFNNGMEYFNTFGGNSVSMVTGLAVLDVIEDEAMQMHALEVGNHLMAGLRNLMDRYSIIGDVRGKGLFIGAEFVKDRHSLEPATEEINYVVERMKDKGFLLSTDGPLYNVLKIKPPMPFNIENADEMVQSLDEVLGEL
jgi:4-aminobutyrate aminotransferase-like enzyme/Ser/Thr protein kinase RdoA (MazF antagonist)